MTSTITSSQHYEAAKARMARFEEALAHAEDRAGERHPLLQHVLRKNVEVALQEIYEALIEYDRRRGLDARTWLLGEEVELPWAMIRARIMAGLTQEELAKELALTDWSIRQFEATLYAGVEFDRLQAIASTLGLRVRAIPAPLLRLP
jgi:hypothetical protein